MRELVVALLAFAVAGIGRAEPVRFDWTGRVASVDPTIGIPIGTPAYGHYVFGSTTPDADPSAGLGQYDDALLEWRVVVEGVSDGTTTEPGFGFIAVDLDFEGAGSHVYEVRPGPAVVLRLTDLDGTAFATDALPLDAPPLAAFEGAALAQLDPQTLAPLVVVEVETLFGPAAIPALPGWGVPVLSIAILVLRGAGRGTRRSSDPARVLRRRGSISGARRRRRSLAPAKGGPPCRARESSGELQTLHTRGDSRRRRRDGRPRDTARHRLR